MFNFLKDKLKGVLNKFSKKVEEEGKEEKTVVEKEAPVKAPKKELPKKTEQKEPPKEEKKKEPKKTEPKKKKTPLAQEKVEEIQPTPEPTKEEPVVEEIKAEKLEPEKPVIVEKPTPTVEKENKGFFTRLKETFTGPKPEEPEPAETKIEKEEPKVEKKGFFERITETITTKRISEEKFDELFWDLELALLENNTALEVIEKIKADLKSEIVDKPLPRNQIEEAISSSLRKSVEDLFNVPQISVMNLVKTKKPYVICFVGINGSGKTTTIAKITNYLKKQGVSVVLAAADTFRAAAIDQLQLHADNLGVKLIRHDYGSDPAAVAFDAVKHAQASKKDVVLIDTAGRLHSNVNLMDEMKKIIRVANPDLKLFIGESITGNDCVEQAKKFNEAIGIDGIVLSKADVDEKGGAAISVSYVTGKPIVFLGVGQEYDDLQVFDKEKLLKSIGL